MLRLGSCPKPLELWYRLPDLSDFDAEIACSLPMASGSALQYETYSSGPNGNN